MTNDSDKLRRLLVWADELRASKSFAGAFIAQELENRVNALLAEPPSPAPAAAPSEAESLIEACLNIDWQQHLLNGGGCFHVEDGKLCGRGRNWPGHQDRGPHLFVPLYVAVTKAVRAATAHAASPPVTSEAIEAAIRRYRSECIAPAEECGGEEMALRNIRALIATAIAEARGSSGLREALVELRKRLDLPGHAECPHPKECPWSDDHEMVAIIDRALVADAKEQTK